MRKPLKKQEPKDNSSQILEKYLDQWRDELEKIANDIYKNLSRDGLIEDNGYWRDDIRQEVKLTFMLCFLKHPETFPPKPGYVYKTAFFSFRISLIGILDHDHRLYFEPHDNVNLMYNSLGYDPFAEEEDTREYDKIAKDNKELRLRKYLDKIGVDTGDYFGPEFALWWQGLSPGDIALLNRTLRLPGKNQRQVEDKLRAVFRTIAQKTGLSVADVKFLRGTPVEELQVPKDL
jgi:hypothetical protein